MWECCLDFGGVELDECESVEDMSIGKLMDQVAIHQSRVCKGTGTHHDKLHSHYSPCVMQGNDVFKKEDFQLAVQHYIHAHEIEPKLPHYQLNLAAACCAPQTREVR